MDIRIECVKCAEEIIEKTNLKKGDLFVIGCSTSEVCGSQIGTNSNPTVAKEIFNGFYSVFSKKGIFIAVQCCEHLNRAIVIERQALPFYEEVNVIPQPKAGGSLATVSYNSFSDPIVVEEISANAGIDIGGTLIGMHLKKVAVPIRLSINKIGNAPIICAKTRPKFIGGERAVYNSNLK